MTAVEKIDYGLIPVIDVARELLGQETRERTTAIERHFDDHGGLFVNLKKNRWYSHGNQTGGDAISLIRFVHACDYKAAFDWLRSHGYESFLGERQAPKKVLKEYDYEDADRTSLYQTVRFEPKDFRQRRSDGNGGWIWKGPERAVPYRLPELIESGNAPVLIAGGERDVDNLRALGGFTATCNHGGEGKWWPELTPYFKGRRVFLLLDNDAQGEKHQAVVGAALNGVASEIRVVRFPELPAKGDVSDFIEQRRKDGLEDKAIERELRLRFCAAPAWAPTAPLIAPISAASEQGDDPHLAALASMAAAEYGRKRKSIAEESGISLKFLDREYDLRRREAKPDNGRSIKQPHWEVEPWPMAVAGDFLVQDLVTQIRAHVVLSDEAALVTALWILLAWCHEAAVHSPILLVTSPEKECGKSTLIGLISFLVPSGMVIVEISPAVLYRMIEAWHPTLLVDEADDIFKQNPELRSVFNSGWTRNAGVPRCNPDTNEPEFFSTFGPKVIGIKGLKIPDTTLSRGIVIQLARKLPTETAKDFDHTDSDGLADLRGKALRWATDNLARVRAAKPTMPADFYNRLAANWRTIFAIADLCGVGEEARKAAIKVSDRDDEPSLAVELLIDIRKVFDELGADRIRRDELLERLVKLEDRPWSEMPYSGKEMTAAQLRKLLKGIYVKIESIKFEGNRTARGVSRDQFEPLWDRYTPASPENKCDRVTSLENSQKKCDPLYDPVTVKSEENQRGHRVTPDLPPTPHRGVNGGVCTACDGLGCPTCLPRRYGIGG
jgi:putative DNA primase/helicase